MFIILRVRGHRTGIQFIKERNETICEVIGLRGQ